MMWLNSTRPRRDVALNESDRRRGIRTLVGADLRRVRRAFTLVELLVAIVLISILSGMVVVTINATQQHSRQMSTQGLIRRIDQVLQSKWDSYRYRPLNVDLDSSSDPFVPMVTPPQILPEEAGRVRLMMLRDLMRMEMPDRMADLRMPSGNVASTTWVGPTPIVTTAVRYEPVIGDPQRSQEAGRVAVGVPWGAPSQFTNYQAKISYQANPDTGWTRQFESAECLYMVIASSTMNGISALDVISPVEIADTDGDGMREIVDSWGTPISWVRWPAGSPHSVITDAGEDEFDMLATDWGSMRTNVETPYNLTPLVISAGPDGILGILTTEYPRDSDGDPQPYSTMVWPPGQTDAQGSLLPRPYYFIDPYDRVNTGGINPDPDEPPTPVKSIRPGAPHPVTGGETSDDILSYNL